MDENNYEIILDNYHNIEFFDKTTVIEEINQQKHKEVKKLLSNYNIVKPWDTNRSCGKSNYFDIAEIKTNSIIQKNSRLIVSRPSVDPSKSIILIYPNWYSKYCEIKEKIIDKGYYTGFKTRNRKVKAWFEDENVLRLGTQKTENVYIEFSKADINSLTKYRYYYMDSETSNKRHLSYQGLIGALGVYFGFKSKIAKNDKSRNLLNINLETVGLLLMDDLDLNSIKERKTKDQIDLIDVMWAREDGKIFAVFEIELKRDWRDVLLKFQLLKRSCNYGEYISYVIVGEDINKDYREIREWMETISFRNDFINSNLKYLPVKNLFDILHLRDEKVNKHKLKRNLFDSLVDIELYQD